MGTCKDKWSFHSLARRRWKIALNSALLNWNYLCSPHQTRPQLLKSDYGRIFSWIYVKPSALNLKYLVKIFESIHEILKHLKDFVQNQLGKSNTILTTRINLCKFELGCTLPILARSPKMENYQVKVEQHEKLYN